MTRGGGDGIGSIGAMWYRKYRGLCDIGDIGDIGGIGNMGAIGDLGILVYRYILLIGGKKYKKIEKNVGDICTVQKKAVLLQSLLRNGMFIVGKGASF